MWHLCVFYGMSAGIAKKWKKETGELIRNTQSTNTPNVLIFLFSYPQCAFFARYSLRNSESRPSAACCEYLPPQLHRVALNLFWDLCVCSIYVQQSCQVGVPVSLPWSLSDQLWLWTMPDGGEGRRWVCSLAPLWHFQLDQLAAISPFCLLKSQCHSGAVHFDQRMMLMLVGYLKSEPPGPPMPP